jgi:hypothetical protein
MNPTKDEIKSWLKREGHSREWLGIQCGNIKRRTVDNWLSSPQEIPEGALFLIARLMAEDAQRAATAATAADPQSHLVLRVALDEYERWEQAALLHTTTVSSYCLEAIREAYQADLGLTLVPSHPEIPGTEKQA